MLDPNSDIVKIDAYPDADFSGMQGGKSHDDTAYAKSCTGFIITFPDCPVLWISRFQTENTFSTMKAEIIDLARCCRELFMIIYITQSLGNEVELPVEFPLMRVSVH